MMNPSPSGSELSNEVVAVLAAVNLFSETKLDPKAMQVVSSIMKRRSYSAGHSLIEQGAIGTEFFVLLKGQVSISKKTPEGDAYKVAVLSHESHPAFGEGGLMEGEVRSASIFCETAVECLVLTREEFDLFCQQYPHYALPIFRRIAQSLMARLNQTGNDLMLLHKALMDEIRQS